MLSKRKPKQKRFCDLQMGDQICMRKGDKTKWVEVLEVWSNELTTIVQVQVDGVSKYMHHTHDTAICYK